MDLRIGVKMVADRSVEMAEQHRLPLKTIDFASLRWTPQSDITPYELALAAPVLIGVRACNGSLYDTFNLFLNLPEHAKRHFSYKMKSA
jgi:hypothetical protein